MKMKRCSKCVLPESYPGIKFNKKGVCNYCLNYKKITIKGKKAFENKISKFKNNSNNKYDCIIGVSGGRDSSYVLYQLVTVYKLKVLACTFKCGIQSELGERNAKKMCELLKVDHVIFPYKIKKNLKMLRKNFLAWIKKPSVAMIPILMLADKTMEHYMRKVAKKYSIKLFFDAESAVEWTPFKSAFLGVYLEGHDLGFFKKLNLLIGYFKEYLKNPRYFLTFDPIENLFGFLAFFQGNLFHKDIELVRYFDYFKWDENEIVSTIKKKLDWELPTDTIMTWRNDDLMPPLYNYLYYKMTGFTENDELRSNMIRNDMIKRSEALKLLNKENKIRWFSIEKLFNKKLKLSSSLLDKVPYHKCVDKNIFTK